jgi:hypothetical protein
MFAEGGQTKKHCLLVMFPEGGQTRKHCFLAMFSEGGQTRRGKIHSDVAGKRFCFWEENFGTTAMGKTGKHRNFQFCPRLTKKNQIQTYLKDFRNLALEFLREDSMPSKS